MNDVRDEVILCLASRTQGQALLRELSNLGCQVILLTQDELRDADWPHEALVEFQTMPSGMTPEQIKNTVCYLARTRNIVRILALSAADMAPAAVLREHMRITGMGLTTTRYFKDVLAMRAKATHLGIRAAAYAPILNYDDLRAFMENVPAPWSLRPRCIIAGANGGEIIEDPEQVWRRLDELGDQQSDFLLEQLIPGEIFSAHGICAEGKLSFNLVRGPVQNLSAEHTIQAIQSKLIPDLGMSRGVIHAKFLRSEATGTLYFLEVSPEPGDMEAVDAIERTTGVNLWREWARVEVAALRGQPYRLL